MSMDLGRSPTGLSGLRSAEQGGCGERGRCVSGCFAAGISTVSLRLGCTDCKNQHTSLLPEPLSRQHPQRHIFPGVPPRPHLRPARRVEEKARVGVLFDSRESETRRASSHSENPHHQESRGEQFGGSPFVRGNFNPEQLRGDSGALKTPDPCFVKWAALAAF